MKVKNIKFTKKHLILIVLIVAVYWIGLKWLALVLGLFAVLNKVFSEILSIIKYKLLKKFLEIIVPSIAILGLFVLIRIFVVDLFFIPSSSMENTLYEKDVILVNKLSYGPKLPKIISDIPWVNYLLFGTDNKKPKEVRLNGIGVVEQGDILVFRYFKNNDFYVKRCVGIAGDTLRIVNGNVFTNGNVYTDPLTVKETYLITVKDREMFDEKIDSYEDEINFMKSDNRTIIVSLSQHQVDFISNMDCVFKVKKIVSTKPPLKKLFPKSKKLKWNLDNYGSLIIPKKGMTIVLTSDLLYLYRVILTKYEEVKIKKKGKDFFMNGELIKYYTFKNDYFFMMGDNRKGSHDSRYFGFLPKEKIVGKVNCVLYSNRNDEFQWDRLIKML